MNTVYILFAGDNFYPEGGVNDLRGIYQTEQDAVDAAMNCEILDRLSIDGSWWHVVKMENGKMVKIYGNDWA